MSFAINASGNFADDTDGSKHAFFAAQVQALFATLTADQLTNFAMNITQEVLVMPSETAVPVAQPAVPVIEQPVPPTS